MSGRTGTAVTTRVTTLSILSLSPGRGDGGKSSEMSKVSCRKLSDIVHSRLTTLRKDFVSRLAHQGWVGHRRPTDCFKDGRPVLSGELVQPIHDVRCSAASLLDRIRGRFRLST